MTRRCLLFVFALVAALFLPALMAPPASAESGAHRMPPAPPIDTPVDIGRRD
ncbi:MAG: hypothetical protein V3V20_10610 [Algisphaera sp.]